jgi:hypothetical protein
MAGADRSRRTRIRRARGYRCYWVDTHDRVIELLIDAGRLTGEQAHDRARVGHELAALIEERANEIRIRDPRLQKNRHA